METFYKNTYFLLRHGQATHNVSYMIASTVSEESDSPSRLTDVGREQSQTAAEKLSKESIDYIYSSPYKRTVDTATIVAEQLGLDIKTDKRLREVDVGTLSGFSEEEYHEYFRGKDKFTEAAEGGESLIDLRNRMKGFLDDMEERYTGKNILIVSHGDPIWMLYSLFQNVEGDEILKMPYPDTGEFKVFRPTSF